MLRFLTAGESHGQALVVVVDGLPAGLTVDVAAIDRELARRQGGYGRGQRMRIEEDRAEVLSGVRHGETLGSPVSLLVRNRDWPNWQRTMPVGREASADAGGARRPPVTRPRPGHADLAGGLKYGRTDLRDVLERASARETAARVAAGSVARQLLAACGVRVASHVTRVAGAVLDPSRVVTIADIDALPPSSPLRCVDAAVEARMVEEIDRARAAGDTVGGAFEVIAEHVPPGLGTYAQWDRRLDGQLAQAVMSIPAIKAVGIGLGARAAELPGSQVHDAIVLAPPQAEFPLARPTNRAGGLEGGVTNGEPLRVTAAMKPISTLMRPLDSVDLATLQAAPATVERSDVCAVAAAAVVGEAMVAFVLAGALLEKFGGDSIGELVERVRAGRAAQRAQISARGPGEPPAGPEA